MLIPWRRKHTIYSETLWLVFQPARIEDHPGTRLYRRNNKPSLKNSEMTIEEQIRRLVKQLVAIVKSSCQWMVAKNCNEIYPDP